MTAVPGCGNQRGVALRRGPGHSLRASPQGCAHCTEKAAAPLPREEVWGQALRRAQAPPRHSHQRSISQSALRTHQLTQKEVPGRGSTEASREANKDRGAKPGPEGPKGQPAEHMWNWGRAEASVRLEGRPVGRTHESTALDQQAELDGTTRSGPMTR